MIICNTKNGQLGNRLCETSHALAYALKRRETILFTELDFAKDLYACTPPKGIKVIVRNSLFWTLVRMTFGRVVDWIVDKMPPATGSRNRCPRLPGLTIDCGWFLLRDEEARNEYRKEICQFFRPKFLDDPNRVRCEDILSREKKNIAVHMRRRDYRTWRDGRHFFDDEVYCRIMKGLSDELDSNVRFVLFSDEKVCLENFKGLDCVCAHGTNVEDQWLMSRCDYIFGPTSTFSAWASYYGHVPRAIIRTTSSEIHLADFQFDIPFADME